MPQAKPMRQPQVRRSRVGRVCLEQIIASLQDMTDDDQAVMAAVVDLMRQGRLRRPIRAARPDLAGQDKAA